MKYLLACDTWDNKELEAIQSVIKSADIQWDHELNNLKKK